MHFLSTYRTTAPLDTFVISESQCVRHIGFCFFNLMLQCSREFVPAVSQRVNYFCEISGFQMSNPDKLHVTRLVYQAVLLLNRIIRRSGLRPLRLCRLLFGGRGRKFRGWWGMLTLRLSHSLPIIFLPSLLSKLLESAQSACR
jgi:hypothetical protein